MEYVFKDNKYICKKCNKSFKTIQAIRAHQVVHSDKTFTCSICNKQIKGALSYRTHVKQHRQDKIFQCSHCWKIFNSELELKKHFCEHTEKNMYKSGNRKDLIICQHCDKQFIDKKDYFHHINNLNNKMEMPNESFHLEIDDKFENKYFVTCKFCNKKFFDIKSHIENYHHISFETYLNIFHLENSNLRTFPKTYSSGIHRIKFDFVPDDKETTSILKRRNEMNTFETNVSKLLPNHVLFADTKFYVVCKEQYKMTEINPDFIVTDINLTEQIKNDININGHLQDKNLYASINKVIECFGDYWHSSKFSGMTNEQHELHIKQLYKQAHIDCLVIWEHELNDIQTLQNKIYDFLDMKI